MKINWFSPLPPLLTGIADHTARILPHLSAISEVTLWTDQEDWDKGLERYAAVRHYTPQDIDWVELNRGDIAVYNIGNNTKFHVPMWRISKSHPGVVVLHDQKLQHFFAGIYLVLAADREGYLGKMEQYYGEEGIKAAEPFWLGDYSNIDAMAEKFPLTQVALENALGVIVHSRNGYENIKAMNRWPVCFATLPYIVHEHNRRAPRLPLKEKQPYRIIVFGHINPNRRVDAILKAIADFSGKERFHIDVYGAIWDKGSSLNELIASMGLGKLVTLHGFVTDADLDKALSSAHLAVNLRYPTMGEASVSQLQVWDHALPSIVTKVDWYADLSEEAVVFVRPGHEVEDLKVHLAAFLEDPVRFSEMGEAGRRILGERHKPETYARDVLDIVSDAARFRLHAVANGMASRTGQVLNDCMAHAVPEDAVKSAAKTIYGMFFEEK